MALWNGTTYSNTHLPYTTTVPPTPVASSELIFPPPLYSACPSADACLDCYKLPSDFIMGVAGSAWQIEGALQSEGRGPSALDGIGLGPYQPGTNDSYITDLNYYLYKVQVRGELGGMRNANILYRSTLLDWQLSVSSTTAFQSHGRESCHLALRARQSISRESIIMMVRFLHWFEPSLGLTFARLDQHLYCLWHYSNRDPRPL